jgi:hypothetical protein
VTPASVDKGHQELVRRIRLAGNRWRRRNGAMGLLRVAATAAASFALVVGLEALVGLPPVVRVMLLALAGGAVIAAALLWVVRPFALRVDAVDLAARIEETAPELGERLESSAELWSKRGVGHHGYSVELIDALIMRTLAEAAGLDFRIAPGPLTLRRTLIAAGGVVLAALIVVAALGPRVAPAMARLARPLDAPRRQAVTISVGPGDTTLVAGDDLEVTATIGGPFRGVARLNYEFEGEEPSDIEMVATEVAETGEEGLPRIATLRDVRTPLTYSVEADGAASPTYSVSVVERPYVTGVRLDYDYPGYTGLLPRSVDENNGDITALRGTSVTVTITSSKPLARADLRTDAGAVEMTRADSGVFRSVLDVDGDGEYSIEIEDRDGLRNPDPPVYSIVAIRDERPLVRIVEPGEDSEAPRSMELPLVISALDDYGISAISLRYALEGSADTGVMKLELSGTGGSRELTRETTWDLSETGLMPGRTLVYYAEVTDNDSVTGPKTTKSESYVIRFPSMAELYSDVQSEHDEIVDELDDLLEEQAELREQFEHMQEDIHSEPEIDWQREEEVESALGQQEDLAEDVVKMADKLGDLTDTMSETDRVTLETIDKVNEIQKLLDEVATDEMRELIEKIRQAMERVRPEDVSEAMENLSLTQDDYLRRLEQTLDLLKRARAEQELSDIADRAQDMAAREEQLSKEAGDDPSGERSEELAAEQERLREEFESLKEDLDDAAEEMAEVDESAASQMREAAAAAEASELSEKMKQAQSMLEEKQSGEASQMCQAASNDLLTLFTRLSQCQGGMSCSVQQRDRETTLRAIDELLGVSSEQERVVAAVTNRSRIPRPELVELVAKETDLIDAMSAIADRMFQVSKDSYVIDPNIYRSFGIVQMAMSRAAAHIANGGSAAGHKEARYALGSVNALIVSLLTANQSSSGSSGGAMSQLMQQLRQLSQQQSDLNNMTEELRRQLEQMGMSASTERQLAELRGRQERIMQEARRLAEEYGDRREILGRLDSTAEDMAKALEEMERSGASQETIDRQKHILSRLLDAQRSLRKRDYTRERTSETGEAYARTAPGGLPDEVTRATQELREDLLRAMQRGYPAEYRELIRAYFRALTESAEGENPAGQQGEGTSGPAYGGER